ncbi:hypothetical protein, partial [Salinispora arenicola]|uniref:hypothetical protein n=1 Tax=Salinispora arenicola TaxID=168697 RepID=UPI00207AF964
AVAGCTEALIRVWVGDIANDHQIRYLNQVLAADAVNLLFRVLFTQLEFSDFIRCVLAAPVGLTFHGIPSR